MRTIRPLLLVAGLATLTGCYQKYLVLQADAVSMTRSDAADRKALKSGDEVHEKWCAGDEPVLPPVDPRDHDSGLADQVIYKAQDGGKRADFITDVRIYRDSDGCALLDGRLARM